MRDPGKVAGMEMEGAYLDDLESRRYSDDVDGGIDVVGLFMREARRHRQLTAKQEVELARRIERGDLVAKRRMIESNLLLVMSIARSFRNRGLPLADLLQDGVVGLVRAAEKFDYRKGFKFSTYATWWIRQAIRRGLDRMQWTIRLPAGVDRRARTIARVTQELWLQLGREPTVGEIASAAKLSPKEIHDARAVPRVDASLDRALGDGDGTSSLGTLLASLDPAPDDEVETSMRVEAVRGTIRHLPARERTVLEMRFGLPPFEEPAPVAEIASALGVSLEWVRQLERGALERLSRDAALEWVAAA